MALTCTSDLFQFMRTFATIIQTYLVRCVLGGIPDIVGAYSCHWLGVRRTRWAPHPWRVSLTCRYSCGVFSKRRPPRTQWRLRSWQRNGRSESVWDDEACTAARSFVPLLFSFIEVMRLDIFEAGLCIVCWREEGITEWRRRIKDRIFCLPAENETSRWTPSVSARISERGFQGSYPASVPATVGGVLKEYVASGVNAVAVVNIPTPISTSRSGNIVAVFYCRTCIYWLCVTDAVQERFSSGQPPSQPLYIFLLLSRLISGSCTPFNTLENGYPVFSDGCCLPLDIDVYGVSGENKFGWTSPPG